MACYINISETPIVFKFVKITERGYFTLHHTIDWRCHFLVFNPHHIRKGQRVPRFVFQQ